MKSWEEFLQSQVKELGSEAIDKWAKTLKIVDFDAGNLYLEAQDSFQLSWFEEHLRPAIRSSLRNNNQRPIKVHLSLANAPSAKDKKIWKPILNLAPDDLDPACTLETYFAGSTNEISFTLLKDALEKSSYNPIYLHGPEGSGKSHLLMACAFYFASLNKQCFYVKAATLTNHIVAAMRTGAMQKFRDLYRQHDVLLVDDIHLLAHRSATQEELFHTFNALHVAGKQIILAGSKLPSLLEGIEPRLTSRFEWGLVLPFQCLEAEERKEFFKQKIEQRHLQLSLQIQSFLLEQLPHVKSLMRALDTIHLQKNKTDASWIDPLLQELKRKALTSDKIVQTTAEIFEIQASDILGRSQNQECSLPRQVAMYLCRHVLKMPFLKIADAFSRDHSTVMTSVKNVEKRIVEQDENLLSTINLIKAKLKS